MRGASTTVGLWCANREDSDQPALFAQADLRFHC